MGQTEFISVRREGGIQFLIEEVGDPDMGNIECLREVMYGEIDLYIGLLHLDIGDDALQIR